ncbi:MAG: hypothetical protein DRQ62_00725 [Gammaproteobacteria bacterium]|nr:MAG: hypothetical protein DRQ62_00725 [Gammaproteobacteria bacterium]
MKKVIYTVIAMSFLFSVIAFADSESEFYASAYKELGQRAACAGKLHVCFRKDAAELIFDRIPATTLECENACNNSDMGRWL